MLGKVFLVLTGIATDLALWSAQDGSLYPGTFGTSTFAQVAHESEDTAPHHSGYSCFLESGCCEGSCGAGMTPLEVKVTEIFQRAWASRRGAMPSRQGQAWW